MSRLTTHTTTEAGISISASQVTDDGDKNGRGGRGAVVSLTYAIDDQDGNQITAGLSKVDAERVAQTEADERGEVVEVYSVEGEEDADGDWQATESWTVEPS